MTELETIVTSKTEEHCVEKQKAPPTDVDKSDTIREQPSPALLKGSPFYLIVASVLVILLILGAIFVVPKLF